MAGSYTIEELYGMVWYLADRTADGGEPLGTAASWVEEARQNYRAGLELSPGTGAALKEEE